jgi:DNA-binding MarR family transcriptional regulator
MEDILNPQYCVANNLHKTARVISRIYGEEMRSSGLQRSQFAILGNLTTTTAIALNQLAERLCMERTTLSRNLKPLVQQGYISIAASSTDGRIKEISITSTGRAKFKQALKLWRGAQQRIINAYGVTSWRRLEESLRDLRSIDA